MAEEKKNDSQRFINSLCLTCQVAEGVSKHVQIVITADSENNLRCYFDVIDPDKLPKFVDE